jgi:hypothetical protein
MQRYALSVPIWLGLCLATPGIAATDAPSTTFDGAYRGSMTLAPSGLNSAYTGPFCVTARPVAMVIRHGHVFLSYKDWHRHKIHYRGRVSVDGRVEAYHRNRDGSLSALTGSVSGDRLVAEMQRGKCDYRIALTKR